MSIQIPDTIASMLHGGRLVHAICLEGETEPAIEVARQIAGAVLCEAQKGGVMCGECLHCRKVVAGVHADFVVHSPEDGGYKKDAMRALRAEMYRSPHEGRAKIMVLQEAQLMTAEVQNLLLKVMEEPPEDSYFILTCDNRYKLLTTVRSRMASATLPPRSESELADELLATDTGKAAHQILLAMTTGGYRLLAALQPCEKNRRQYETTLLAVEKLLGYEQVCNDCGISLARRLSMRSAVTQALARGNSNGHLPTISAAFTEQVARRG